jgi:hypothetical protein
VTSPAPIQDKAPKPAGLLPKNIQSWLLVSLAVLMVLIMWITGGKKPAAPARAVPSAPAVQAPLEVNEAKIVEMQNRIQQLQREQNVAESALAQQTRALAGAEPPSAGSGVSNNGGVPERAEDSILAERKKRDYLSLFASNVALSYRKNSVPPPAHENESHSPATPVTEPSAAQVAELLKPLQLPAPPVASPPSHKESAAEN